LPAIVAFYVGWRLHRPKEVLPEGVSVGSEAETRTLRMPYGSEIELSPRARVTLVRAEASEERIVLERGAASFHVVHDPTHRFVVVAGAVQVIDIGTVFRVAHDEAAGGVVRVSVTSGDVEVRSSEGPPRQLHAGESLVTPETAPATGRVDPPASSAAGALSGQPADANRPDRREGADANTDVDPAPGVTSSAVSIGGTSLVAPKAVAPAVVASPSTSAVESNAPSAKTLLSEAMAARQAGNAAAAAQALDTLRKRFPKDPRAPLATLELGRIRMDELGDPRGALEALRTVSGEDAEARVVLLYDTLGEPARCRAARDAFLSRYPASVHRGTLEKRCP
jgi:hypothetical protein